MKPFHGEKRMGPDEAKTGSRIAVERFRWHARFDRYQAVVTKGEFFQQASRFPGADRKVGPGKHIKLVGIGAFLDARFTITP
jgi:hypothetical protein